MATKKDLIEAQGFSRRRLLTAFTSGAPAGKELEPANPLRAVIAGVVLTAMVVLGGVFYGIIRPGLPSGWENNHLVLVKDTGARYVSRDGVLYPVLNSASARLLMPAGEYQVITTDRDSIADIQLGATVGIVGAPDDLPAPRSLISDNWLACAVDGGTAVVLPRTAKAKAVGEATVVVSDGRPFVIVGDHSYAVDPSSADPVLRAVGLDANVSSPVDGRWLNLFVPGTDLAPLEVPGAGAAVAGTNLKVGTAVHTEGAPKDLRFLMTKDGKLAPLSPLAYQLYLLGTGADLGGAKEVKPSEIANVPTAADAAGGRDWPDAVLSPLDAGAVPCALLGHDPDGAEHTVLGVPHNAASLPDAGDVKVEVGGGALVRAGDGPGSGLVHLIDETGTAFAVPGSKDNPVGRLGYKKSDVSAVSSGWIQFFAAGPDLTVEAAGTSPSTTSAPSTSDTPTPTPTPTPAALGASSGPHVDATPQQCTAGTIVYSIDPPTALATLQTDRAWTRATGAGVVVAVVDSGIDVSNAHLTSAVVGGVDLVGDGQNPNGLSDVDGHGTTIAGEIAARAVDTSGVIGVARDAKLLSVRVFRGTDDESVRNGWGPQSDRIAAGIRWASDNGAQIINVSLSDSVDVPSVRDAVAYATANGSLVVASAGNRATTTDEADGPRYPAADPGALAVAAADEFGRVTDASIHGPHVDVAAPGANVLSSATGAGDCEFATQSPSTSFATGYASAAAALVAQAHPDESPAQWAYRLMATAARANPDARDDSSGWGIIQPVAAIDLRADASIRGPESPFADGAAGSPQQQPGVQLTQTDGASPFVLTREAATLVAVGGGTVLATFGVLGLLRSRRRGKPGVSVDEETEPGDGPPPALAPVLAGRGGLLDRKPDEFD